MRSLTLLGGAVLALACSKEPAPLATDFARGGIPDDSIEPIAPAPAPTAR